MSKARILFWDIEASNLKADWGIVFCVGYKFLGDKKVSLMTIRDYPKAFTGGMQLDKGLIRDFSKVYNSADVAVGHYSTRFDRRFINTRCLEQGLPPLANIAEVDTWKIAYDNLAMSSNRLDSLNRFLETKHQKTPITPQIWCRAEAGHGPSIKYIEEHCIADIECLEEVYHKIKPFMKNHPNLAKYIDEKREGCATCGSFDIQYRGNRLTARGYQKRVHCQSCGGWSCVPKGAKLLKEKAD